MYKAGTPPLVTHAGILGLALAVAALFMTFFVRPPSIILFPMNVDPADPFLALQLALFTICGYGIVGAIDDRNSLPHIVKAVVPVALALPAAGLAMSRPHSQALLGQFPALQGVGGVVLAIFVPIYVLVVANLVNMHSGFNGLQSGVSLILLGTLLVRFALAGEDRLLDNLALILVAGSVAAFYPFNRLPARAIEGNVGSFLVGAAIGTGLVTNGLFLAGVVMLAPHILDFLLFAYAKASGRGFVKYGTLRPDGTIQAPSPFKLKFLFPSYFRLTERQTVRVLYALTLAFCAASFLVPF